MSAGYGSIPAVKAARARRAAPMLALMGLAVVAVVAVVVLTTQARAVEMVDFPQDDLGILREMVRPRPRPRPTRVLPTCVLPVHTARSCWIRRAPAGSARRATAQQSPAPAPPLIGLSHLGDLASGDSVAFVGLD